MKISFPDPEIWVFPLLLCSIFFGIFFETFLIPESKAQEIEAIFLSWPEITELVIIQENTLDSFSNPANPPPLVVKKLPVIVTAYSSTRWETDEDPHITAAGTQVRDGIVANNFLPFGTKIKIPELYGDKIFIVEDRMNWEKGKYQIDIWFSDYWQALNFGARRTYIEILKG